MRGSLVGRARAPNMSFLGISRWDHTLQIIFQTGGSVLSHGFLIGSEGRAESWGLGVSWERKCLHDQGSEGRSLLCIPISWLVRRVGYLTCITLVTSGSSHLWAWGLQEGDPASPPALDHRVCPSSLFSHHDTIFPLNYLKHQINFQCAYEVQRANCVEN